MTVLVTGASGFVGSAVTRALLARGETVRVLVRPTSDRANIDGLPVETVIGDLRRPETLTGALDGCRFLGKDMAIGIEGQVNHRWSQPCFHGDQGHGWFFGSQHFPKASVKALHLGSQRLLGIGLEAAVWIGQYDRITVF